MQANILKGLNLKTEINDDYEQEYYTLSHYLFVICGN